MQRDLSEMTGILIAAAMFAGYLALAGVPPRSGLPKPLNSRTGESAGQRAGIADAALMMDLIGAMLAAGAPVDHAIAVLAKACSPAVAERLESVKTALDLGAEWDVAWAAGARGVSANRAPNPVDQLRDALRFAGTTGAPSAAIVHAHAAQLRRRQNRELEKRAASLGVKLVVPLGLCALPAFICLGVMPVLLALLPSLP